MRIRVDLLIGFSFVLLANACSGDDTGSADAVLSTTTTAQATTTSEPVTTTEIPGPTADEALQIADAYFANYNSGDVEAVLALFDPAATFDGNFGPLPAEEWEQRLAWNAAQGTTLSEPTCNAALDSGGAMVVNCPHTSLDALVQAVSGPPVPISLTLTIAGGGIVNWAWIFGSPDFNTVGDPFDRWVTEFHPEEAALVGFGNWTTVDEARENGLLTARYAAEWSNWLAENDCDYRLGC